MVSSWAKFRLLMWKNCLIQFRHPIQAVLEVLIPALFGVILIAVRALVVPTTHTVNTIFQPFDIDTLDPLRLVFWIFSPNYVHTNPNLTTRSIHFK